MLIGNRPSAMHVGRSWGGPGWIEASDECSCEKAPCGLALIDSITNNCKHHSTGTLRTVHNAENCKEQSAKWMDFLNPQDLSG